VIRLIALLLVFSSMSAEADQTASKVNMQAYKAHRVAESVDAFSVVCLGSGLSGNKALAAAKASNYGLASPPMLKASGQPLVNIWARIDNLPVSDPDAVFEWLKCSVSLRGTWADVIFPEVKSQLKAAGFRIASGFKRKAFSPAEAYKNNEAVLYRGTVTRTGHTFVVTVAHAPSGAGNIGEFSTIYVSGTTIEIESK
jgi:hypothetical protein